MGILAFALMLIHSVWARIAVTFKQERVLRSFHRFSVHVWALWMAALVSGIVLVAALSPGLSPGTEQCKKADSQLSLSHVPADTKVDAL